MTNSNPKSLLKLYKYNNLPISSTEMTFQEKLASEVEIPKNSSLEKEITGKTPNKKPSEDWKENENLEDNSWQDNPPNQDPLPNP